MVELWSVSTELRDARIQLWNAIANPTGAGSRGQDKTSIISRKSPFNELTGVEPLALYATG
jgi:hypothetical protein